jgi:aminoglycoside 3-N-acetyltransferase
MLAYPEALRSTHPTNSVVAIGAAAQSITESHPVSSTAYSPYSTLAELGGKFLAIGIGKRLVGLRHEAQYLAGLLTVIPPFLGAPYVDTNGRIRVFVRVDKGGCVRRFPEMVDPMIKSGMIVTGRIGDSDEVLLADIPRVLSHMTDLLTDSPETYLCSHADCLWCREIERRLFIHHAGSISHRDKAARQLIAALNWYRRRYPGQPHFFSYLWQISRSISSSYS